MTFPSHSSVIVAGSTGLIGSALISQLLADQQVSRIIALSRRELAISSEKLLVAIDPDLTVPANNADLNTPKTGFICLGTTIKQAGSKQALENIDRHLVVRVATQMKSAGVTHLAVVSSIGANPKSPSHYLRCKGLMEQEVEALGFDHVVFAQPGPLSGAREVSRKDEALLQTIMNVAKPLMIGSLKKYIPISGEAVASAMTNSITQESAAPVRRLNTVELRSLLPQLNIK